MTTKVATELYVGNAVAAITIETDDKGAAVTLEAGVMRATFTISERELRRLRRMMADAVEHIEAAQVAATKG